MPYKQGQRVQYRNEQGQQAQGKIERTEGQGQQSRHTVMNEKTHQTEQVPENQIEREL
ncbi:hypothetical protein [Streptomyces sp. NPDC005262]|uniref:hypothetical protein n=1 Tax=Streptomyces sp. NPDC005262 TaxID=3364710 RepID=UPI0036BADB9B